MLSLSWTAALVPLLAAVARTSRLAAVSPAEDPPPQARLAFVPVVSRIPDHQLSFEDYTATNNLGDGGQFYSSGRRDPRTPATGRLLAVMKKRANISPNDSHIVKFPARSRRSPALSSSPALDTVDDTSSRWSFLSHADKPRFVTSKGGRAPGSTSSARSGAEAKVSAAADAANPRSNEIPRSDEAYQLRGDPRYDASRDYLYRDLTPVDDFALPPPPQQQPRKRIIYYANLPEVVHHGPGYAPPRVYDGYPGFRPTDVNKYPRESRFDYGPAPVAISSGDRFTYVPGGRTTYTIIDATPPGYYDTGNRYSKVPSPYQPQLGTPLYPRGGGGGGGVEYVDYRGRSREAVRPPPPGRSYVDGPYRDYNPRQPAPWSMQVGARLLVNDDGRPMAPRPGNSGRPFYVESQRSSGGYPSRYPRTDDKIAV